MKQIFALLVLLPVLSFAETTTDSPELKQTAQLPDSSPHQVTVGVGLILFEDTYGISVPISAAFRVGPPIYVGLDSGFRIYRYTFVDGNGIDLTLPLLATIYFQPDFNTSVRPFLGVSAGPTLFLSRSSFVDGSQLDIGSGNWQRLARIGFDFGQRSASQIRLETKLGWSGDNFFWSPQVSGVFGF